MPIARGFALGYRKGPKGSVWLARLIEGKGRQETTLGPADDALDADGEHILDYAQAQAHAREWSASLHAHEKPGPYTVNSCLDDYISDYRRRGGKALDRLEITANAFIRPQLGAREIDAVTGISRRLQERLCASGAMPPPDVRVGRKTLYFPQTVRDWLAQLSERQGGRT